MSNADSNSDFYNNLLARLLTQTRATKLDEQIYALLRAAYEKELTQEKIVLSRSEQQRLFRQMAEAVLAGVNTKLEESKK